MSVPAAWAEFERLKLEIPPTPSLIHLNSSFIQIERNNPWTCDIVQQVICELNRF